MKRIELKRLKTRLDRLWWLANRTLSQDEAARLRNEYRLVMIQYRSLRDQQQYVSM